MYYTVYRKRRYGGSFANKKKNYFNFSDDKFCTMDVIGYQCFNQYYCAVKDLLRHQRSLNVTILRNSALSTEEMNNLIQYFKHRGEDVTRKTFKERFDGTFAPFKLPS